jgi:hypothetical protein
MGVNGGKAAGFVAADVTGDALSAVKDLDGQGGVTSLDLPVNQGIGRAVVMTIDLDVIVDVDAGFFPLGEVIGFGGQRMQGRAVELEKPCGADAGPGGRA